jgi:hypothetical protein
MHATLQQDFVFSRILISVSRISTMRATKFGRGSDLGNHDLRRAGSWQQLLSGAVPPKPRAPATILARCGSFDNDKAKPPVLPAALLHLPLAP